MRPLRGWPPPRGPATPLPSVVGGLWLIGAAFALFASPDTSAVMSSIPDRSPGIGAAAFATMPLFGRALSMAFVALVTARFAGGLQIKREVAPFSLASSHFAFFAAPCAVGILASLARGRLRPHPDRA